VSTLTKAGRYELVEELGRGAMGIVYRAQDPVIGRTVAVKTVRLVEAGTGMNREDLIARFKTEARAAGQLAHPNIVIVHDAGEEDGLFYITMELVEGRSLQALLDDEQSFPVARVLQLMEQACSALDYAHLHKVVHRDIKPANLMFSQEDRLKITDFGTAKILQMGATQTASVIGTPSYMSPEQIKGKPVDGRADLFALGVILYELVTGQKPFPGETVTTVIYKIVNEDPIPPREIDASIHPGLAAAITRSLQKDPDARFQTGREMWEALKNHHLGARGSARANSPAYAGELPTMRLPAATSAAQQQSAARPTGLQTAMAGASRKTAPPILQHTEAEPEQHRVRNFIVALLLLGVIGYAGQRIWPTLKDLWLHARETPAANVSSSPAASATSSPAVEPTTGPAVTATPGAAPAPAANSAPAPSVTPAPSPSSAHQPALPQTSAGGASSKSGSLAQPQPSAVKAPAAAPPVANSAPAPIPAQPKNDAAPGVRGTVNVISDPPDANIALDGEQQIAKTPASLSLAPGTYRITVTKPGYEPYRQELEVTAGQPVHINTTLQPLPTGDGWVWARSVPKGAEISVDGNPTGQRTPARLDLPAGLHVISFALAGYRAQAEVDIHSGRGMQLYRVLLEPGEQGPGTPPDQQ
jgi:serine/threonine protein kinase